MAELLLKIGDEAGFEDGDVLHAFNDRRICQVHTEHICCPKGRPDLNPRTRSGFLIRGTLTEELCAQMFRHCFERVSASTVKRTDLVTLDEVLFDGRPRLVDGRVQAMDVDLFLRNRLLAANHGIFGDERKAVWYGTSRTPDIYALGKVWDRIEADTKLRRSDHTQFPFVERTRSLHLPISFEDFDDATAADYVAPLVDQSDPDNVQAVKKREKQVAYKEIFPDRVSKILDKSAIEDLRDQIARTSADMATKKIDEKLPVAEVEGR